jgi:diacylglycerol O-acyltransferase / wax synthase
MAEIHFDDRMSDVDALMWMIEKDPLLRSTITWVVLFDQAMDRGRFHDAIERTTRMVPRLRQRVQAGALSFGPPRWETDPNFDLGFHVRFLGASGDGTLRDVLDLAEPIATSGFDRARPLWEIDVVEGLEGGRSALILKLHHAITDGVGGVELAMHLFDLDRNSADRGALPLAPPVRATGQLQRWAEAVDRERRRSVDTARRSMSTGALAAADVLADPRGAALRVADTLASAGRLLAPATQPLSDVLAARSLSVRFDTLRVPVAELKAAARTAGGKLNDAFVAGVAGGLRQYHLRQGSTVGTLRMTMPINIRTDETANIAGNKFAPARFPVPIDVDDPIERMRRIRGLVAQARDEPALSLAEPLSVALCRMPTSVTTSIFGSLLKGVDFVTSNVPGVPIPVFLAGARMEAQFPFGPRTGAATNITLMSYLDEAQIGINLDPAAVTEPEEFVECLRDGFAEVLKASSNPSV